MKKFYSAMMMLAMMVAALSFTACGSDDDDNDEGEISSSEIVGTWKSIDAEGWIFDDEVEKGEGAYIQFKKDGTFIRVDIEDLARYSGDWKIRSNRLSMHYHEDGTTIVYDIMSSNNKELVLVYAGLTMYLKKVSDSEINKYLH